MALQRGEIGSGAPRDIRANRADSSAQHPRTARLRSYQQAQAPHWKVKKIMPGDRDKLQQLAQFYRGPPRLFRNREEERWWSDKDAGLIVEAREEGSLPLMHAGTANIQPHESGGSRRRRHGLLRLANSCADTMVELDADWPDDILRLPIQAT